MPGVARAAFRWPRDFLARVFLASVFLASVFLARVLATAPDARFFRGCFFVSRIVRRTRGFAAMIPLTPPWLSMACHRSRSHDGLFGNPQ
jgi:hypothetical protein